MPDVQTIFSSLNAASERSRHSDFEIATGPVQPITHGKCSAYQEWTDGESVCGCVAASNQLDATQP